MSQPAARVERSLTRDAILDAFFTYGREAEGWLVGGEFERHLLDANGIPVPYSGEHGVRWLLGELAQRGWTADVSEGHLIGVHRDGNFVTLEPGSQFELSGAPVRTVTELAAQARAFHDEVEAIVAPLGVQQVALGFTPFAQIPDIEWLPKGRYVVMREYLLKRGALAHHMMKGTAAVQSSFDFRDEEDAARKIRLAWRFGPLITAMFANSPLAEGKPTGFQSFRGHIWRNTDPDRTGFPTSAGEFSFERWVDYLLDVPMMFVKSGERWLQADGRNFRWWLDHDLAGRRPTWADWELHMTSVFPEVRIKRQIEVRGADCVPLPLALSFTALFEGLFYCNRVVDRSLELGGRFSAHGTPESRFDEACRNGLEGRIGGRRLADWATDLLELAVEGLERCMPGDRSWLEPLERQVATGRSRSADVLDAFARDPSPAGVMRASALLGRPGAEWS